MSNIVKENLDNPAYLRNAGLEVLQENLGNVGTIMFLKQFETGSGDYTKEREFMLGNQTIEDFEKDLKNLKERNS